MVPFCGEVRSIGATTLSEYKEAIEEGNAPRVAIVLNKGPLEDGFDRPSPASANPPLNDTGVVAQAGR